MYWQATFPKFTSTIYLCLMQGCSQDFSLEGGGGRQSDCFSEKCSLLVDSLRRTSECYIEVEQKGGGGAFSLGATLATPLI